MATPSAQLVCHYLHRLTARDADALSDHQLVQRFVLARDEHAFATLVERHAALVLGLCRSILHNRHDAEDVFQATFLVLARKAGSLRKGESVGSYLYAVATRLAHKARLRDDRRRRRERRAASPEAVPADDLTWGELRGVLHEEVSRLPEKWRAAVVLCYWQGRTHEEAARHLGCARATVKDRLERARQRLHVRLARRGLALSAAWAAVSLSGEVSSPAVAAELVQATVRGAMLFAAGRPAHGMVSAQAVAGARSALQAMWLGKLKIGLVLALMLGVLGGVSWVLLPQGPGRATAAPPGRPESPDAPPPASQRPATEARLEDPLPPGAVARLGTLRFRHGDHIHDIALSRDGKSIVSAAGKVVHVWEMATGKERSRLTLDVVVRCVAPSPVGKLLALGGEDGTVRLCDPETGREVRRLEAHKPGGPQWQGLNGVSRLLFTPDGRLVSSGSDQAVRIWDADTGKPIREIGRFGSVRGLTLSPDGKALAGAVQEGDTWTVRVWQTAIGKEGQRLPPLGGTPYAVAISPDGNTLAVSVDGGDGNKPGVIKLWDLAGRKEVHSLRGHKGGATWLVFSPDGKTLASTSAVGVSARLWDMKTGAVRYPLGQDWLAPLFKVLFSPDGKSLVSYGQENALRFWDAATGKEVRASDGAQSWVGAVAFSPDGRLLASGSGDGLIQLWDVATRKEVRRLTHSGPLIGLAFSPDGRRLASAGMFDQVVCIWDAAGGKQVGQVQAPGMFITCLAWSGDGKVLATWSRLDRIVHLWSPATGKEVHVLGPIPEWVNGVAFAPDGRTLAIGVAAHAGLPGGERKENLLLWSADTGKLLRRLPERAGVRCLTFSPDGKTLAAGGMDRAIHLWELASAEKRLTLPHGEEVTSLAYSSDGRVLAAVNNTTWTRLSSDGTTGLPQVGKPERPRVRLWDLSVAQEIPALRGHQGAITALAFSPDGGLLATASNDTTVLLWTAPRPKAPDRPADKLRPEQLESLWSDLRAADAVKAYRAVCALAATPEQGVGFLKRRLEPVAAADSRQVARLLADLDGADFAARERATRELEKLGERAAPQLRVALAGDPSTEARRRIERLLERANGRERLGAVRAVEVLEMADTREARRLCEMLAGGVAEATLTREARTALEGMKRRPAPAP
jgi:RNA polymerase sigma factor (sigma-70 family)